MGNPIGLWGKDSSTGLPLMSPNAKPTHAKRFKSRAELLQTSNSNSAVDMERVEWYIWEKFAMYLKQKDNFVLTQDR